MVSLWGDQKFCQWRVVVIVQHCEYTKCYLVSCSLWNGVWILPPPKKVMCSDNTDTVHCFKKETVHRLINYFQIWRIINYLQGSIWLLHSRNIPLTISETLLYPNLPAPVTHTHTQSCCHLIKMKTILSRKGEKWVQTDY